MRALGLSGLLAVGAVLVGIPRRRRDLLGSIAFSDHAVGYHAAEQSLVNAKVAQDFVPAWHGDTQGPEDLRRHWCATVVTFFSDV